MNLVEKNITPPVAASLDEVILQQKKKKRKVKEKRNPLEDNCFTFTLDDPNQLTFILDFLRKNRVYVPHKEVKKLKDCGKVKVYAEFITSRQIDGIISQLSELRGLFNIRHDKISLTEGREFDVVPWFPRCVEDLDESKENVIMCGEELDADHPGFTDEEYRKRRACFTEIAMKYKCGDAIPRIKYTEEETETWSRVYSELASLYPMHACKQQIENIRLLAENCGFNEDDVPQLEDVSRFLQSRTGFTLRPAAGFLSPRDFLAGLAFRVFNCTQYMRHSGDPLYTPEPDVCHELLGHVPLLADPSFAQFSQELGLASLGANDADIKRLASCYLYTVEFGLCKENGKEKAYGAGLLSCIAELKHALTTPEKLLTFDPEVAATTESFVTCFQPKYFVSESLEEVKDKMREFVRTIKRPFQLEHCDETNTIRVKGISESKTANGNLPIKDSNKL